MLQVRTHANFTLYKLRELKNKDNTLKIGCKHLQSYNYFLSDGTALGFYRDGDFIDSDTDIDVVVYANIEQQHILIPQFTLIRTMEWKKRPIQTAYIDTNNVIFDIYYYYPDIIENKWTTLCGNGMIALPRYNISLLNTKYGPFPFPENIEEYLKLRYGDWKTPKSSKGYHIPNKY